MENKISTRNNNDISNIVNSKEDTKSSFARLDTIPEENTTETSSMYSPKNMRNSYYKAQKYKRSDTQIRPPINFDKNKIINNNIYNTINLCRAEFISKIFIQKRSDSYPELRNSYKNMLSKIDIDDLIVIDFDDNNSISSQSDENKNEEINPKENEKQSASRRKNNNTKIIDQGRSKSFSIEKGMSSYYIEENETDNEKMQFKTKKLKCISLNLMLKEIIFKDFLNEFTLNVYHFCQQCFAFINKDVLFKKVWNCYLWYKKQNLSLDKLRNLFDFLGILVIEMYDYCKIIKKNDLILKIIKSLYYQIISDLIINLNNEDSKFEHSKISNSEFINRNIDYEAEHKIYKLIRKLTINDIKTNDYVETEESVGFEGEARRKRLTKGDIDSNETENLESVNTFNSSNYNISDYSSEIQSKNTFESEDLINAALIQGFLYEDEKELSNDINHYEQHLLNTRLEEVILCNFSSILKILESEKPLVSDLMDAKNKIPFYEKLKQDASKEEKITIIKKRKEKLNNQKRSCSALNIKKEKMRSKICERKYMQQGFFSMMDWEPSEIGGILIKRTRNLFNKIERKEFYNSVFLKKDKNILSPNIQNATKKMGDLSSFIIEDILSYNQKEDRAKTIEKWTLVAEFCKNERDYNDCVAINSAFQNYIITGLKKTLKKIDKKIKNTKGDINHFCTIEGNYKYIREEMRKNISAGKSFYPYLGLLTKDIVYDDEKFKYLIDQEYINFEKIENIQKMLDDNFKFKNDYKRECEMKNIPELIFFEKLEVNANESELEQLAEKLEPPQKNNKQNMRTESLLDEKIHKRKTKIDEKYFSNCKINNKNMGKTRLKSNGDLVKIKI